MIYHLFRNQDSETGILNYYENDSSLLLALNGVTPKNLIETFFVLTSNKNSLAHPVQDILLNHLSDVDMYCWFQSKEVSL